MQLCGFWTLPPSLCPMNPDPSLVDLVEQLSSSPLLYVGFGSMETFMLDINWETLFNILDSGTPIRVVHEAKAITSLFHEYFTRLRLTHPLCNHDTCIIIMHTHTCHNSTSTSTFSSNLPMSAGRCHPSSLYQTLQKARECSSLSKEAAPSWVAL